MRPNKARAVRQGRRHGTMVLAAALPFALLAGCGSETAAGPGGVTADEARALEEAASMLDEQRLPAAAQQGLPAEAPPPGETPTPPAGAQ